MTRTAPRRTTPRWVELLPAGLLVVAFAAKGVANPNAVRDVFSGTQAFLVTAAIFAGWLLLWLVVLARLVPNAWVRTGILLVASLVLIFVLVLPTFVDTKVVEALPATSSPAQGRSADRSATVDPPPTEPTALATGEFRGLEHDANGTAVLYQRPDGTFFVGLESFDIEPGPDYHVYVVPGADQTEPGDRAVYLDALRGNQGTQYYEVPADTDLDSGRWTVLIWCRAFAVGIANASPV